MRISDWSSDVCSSDLATSRSIWRIHPSQTVAGLGARYPAYSASRLIVWRRCAAAATPGWPKSGDQYLFRGRVRRGDHPDFAGGDSLGKSQQSGLVRRHVGVAAASADRRSEEHTSELQSLMRITYAVFCLKKKKKQMRTLSS